jgi:myosin-18
MESQITRLKEGIEKISNECEVHRTKEMATQDMSRKLQRQLRELREDYATLQQKETEANARRNELEKQLELAEAETVMVF